jgi:glycosyltransferase involved in cell wall biosynthesis
MILGIESIGHDAVAIDAANRSIGRASAALNRLSRYFGRDMCFDRTRWSVAAGGRKLLSGIEAQQPDAVICTTSLIVPAISRKRPPLAIWTDCVLPQMVGYYSTFAKVPGWRIRQLIALEKAALIESDLIVLSSEWAVQGVRLHYPALLSKTVLVPFGPNNPPGRDGLPSLASGNVVLSVGVDWDRKGMATLVEACALVRKSHPDLVLEIVGCAPPDSEGLPEWVFARPRVNPGIDVERRVLESHFSRSSVFALLSRAECAGIAYIEASAYGLPVVGTRTGGVSSMVKDQVTGILVPVDDPTAAAVAISRLLGDSPEAMSERRRMGAEGKSFAEERSWSRGVREVLSHLLSS